MHMKRMRGFKSQEASISIEFALALPLLLVLLAALYDLTDILLVHRRMAIAADALTQIATNILADPARSDNETTMQSTYAQQTTDATFDYLPDWEQRQAAQFSITLSFLKTTSSSTAQTLWSYASSYGLPIKRPCSVLNASTSMSLSTVPSGILSSPYVISADIGFNYTPMFSHSIIGSVPLIATAFMPTRTYINPQQVQFNPATDPNVTICN